MRSGTVKCILKVDWNRGVDLLTNSYQQCFETFDQQLHHDVTLPDKQLKTMPAKSPVLIIHQFNFMSLFCQKAEDLHVLTWKYTGYHWIKMLALPPQCYLTLFMDVMTHSQDLCSYHFQVSKRRFEWSLGIGATSFGWLLAPSFDSFVRKQISWRPRRFECVAQAGQNSHPWLQVTRLKD